MNNPIKKTMGLRLTLAAKIFICSACVNADVDDADSLDFEAFHRQDSRIKTAPIKPTKENRSKQNKKHHDETPKSTTYEIREPYSTEPQSVTTAIANGYLQMGRYCPEGWEKIAEWSNLEASKVYLYMEFRCTKQPQ